MDQSRIAVVGLGAQNQAILQAAQSGDEFVVVGASDHDAQRVDSLAGVFEDIELYGDSRQMVLQTKPDLVFLAIPPAQQFAALEFLAMQGIAAFKSGSLARNLTEAASVVRMFRDKQVPLGVGNPRRDLLSYRAVLSLQGEPLSSVRCEVTSCVAGSLGWRGDRKSAGGGVLLYPGLEMLDVLIEAAGLPEAVYAAARTQRPAAGDTTTPVHDTDDTAMGLLHYSNRTIGQFFATRTNGPAREEIELFSPAKSVRATADTVTEFDASGQLIEEETWGDTYDATACEQALQFARDIAAGVPTSCPGQRMLLAHATAEAMYLSCRTGRPESPQQQLQIHGLTLEQCIPTPSEE
jgi:predicted dehydrogenase